MPQAPKIYFAFPDRAYHYDCAQCDALCCRGHGIGTTPKETPALLAHYPALALAATNSGPTGSNFTNPAGGCFFLTEKNLCQIEEEHGRSEKPGVCVLFPFNDFSRLGDWIVVRPHFLCPLRLRPGEGVGRHAELEKQLHETGVLARAQAQPGPDLSPKDAREKIQREEMFRDQCEAAIGMERFESLLERGAKDKTEFRRWQERALRIWGVPHEFHPHDSLDDILLALAPPLRMRAILSSERKRLRILFLASAYVRNVARATARPLTLQGAHHMIVNVLPVIRMLARGNTSIRFPAPESHQGVEFQNPQLTLAFFQILEDLQAGNRLFDVLEKNMPKSVAAMERAIFFHQLAQRVLELRKGR